MDQRISMIPMTVRTGLIPVLVPETDEVVFHHLALPLTITGRFIDPRIRYEVHGLRECCHVVDRHLIMSQYQPGPMIYGSHGTFIVEEYGFHGSLFRPLEIEIAVVPD
jgi:hypothetical protein